MAKFPAAYERAMRRVERDELFEKQRGTRVRSRPWPHYDVAFVRSELARYEREEREIYDDFCSDRVPPLPSVYNPNLLNIASLYRDGFLRTFGWFLGENPSPLHGSPPPATEKSYRAEFLAAMVMTDDSDLVLQGTPLEEVYGDFEPQYVTAVYRTLEWVTAGPEGRQYSNVLDPLIWR